MWDVLPDLLKKDNVLKRLQGDQSGLKENKKL